jgi:hypothetical protein
MRIMDIDLTDSELELVTEEILDRVKDLLYIRGEETISDALRSQIYNNTTDTITVSYSITISVLDVLQIIGRLRRDFDIKGVEE